MTKLLAVTRPPTDALARCELTHLERQPIDIVRAREQHRGYERGLADLGVTVVSLPPEPEFPDAVFVEDTAVVLDEIAVLARPGAESRRGEVRGVAQALVRYRPLAWIVEPGTLDGGDVMRVGRTVYVGQSARTNLEGIGQFRAAVARFGYEVIAVPVNGCLHLKSACTHVGGGQLLANRAWFDVGPLKGVRIIDVAPSEPRAANTLVVGETVVMAAAFPRTRAELERHGFVVRTLDLSELQKAEAGGSCLSLLFEIGTDGAS